MRLVIALMIAVMVIISVVQGPGPARADDMTDYCFIPPFIARQGPPLVTIVLGRDHKLYYEAYNDASDLNDDGVLDVGYKHTIKYYGYFDSNQCYTYDGTQFNPSGVTSDMYCGGGEWSGNFLNWLSMSRADVLRKVLYGGHRSTDTATETVLEGVYIPQDAHSWGKEYAESDTAQLTPYSAPTSGRHLFCVTSTALDAPHRIRVSLNNSNRIWEWASKERTVCDDSQTINDEYMVRVKVCATAPAENTDEYRLCKLYPSKVYKPVGILQRYGTGDGVTKVCSKTFKPCANQDDCDAADGDCIDLTKMYFALVTGSYARNLSGGVLRKTMRNMSDEIDPVDGTFTGAYTNTDGAIIPTLETLKTVGFRYSDYTYEGTYDCGWIQDRPITEGECRMWGNPIAEMMYEALRYLADRTTPEFGQSSPDTGLNLAAPTWDQPFEKYPWCSKPSMLVISDVKTSYDSDQLPGSAFASFSGDDLGGLDVTDRANAIGANEGIGTTKVFIGQSGTTPTDNVCSAKDVSGLGEIRGQCPEEPIKEGSYYAAAVAHYGKTEFKNLLMVDAVEEDDKIYYPPVTTYGVALSSPIPDIKIKVGSDTVTLIPAGKLVSGCDSDSVYKVWPYCGQRDRTGDFAEYSGRCDLDYYDASAAAPFTDRGLVISNCMSDPAAYCMSSQIVDFYVDGEITPTHGKFRINFEDAEQGADHDMDAIVMYEYTVINSNTVRISLDSSSVEYPAGCVDQVMGFFISGTGSADTDGLYLPVKSDHTPDAEDNWTPAAVAAVKKTWSKEFTISPGGETATLLKDPLWYAAKYGGFNDIDGSGYPDDPKEWDRDGNTVPDTYFLVHNPLELEDELNKALGEILKRISAGTAVSVLSTSAGGEGSLFQAYFNPSVFDEGREVTWVGYLNALWVDQYGNLREDNGNQRLVLTEDKIIEFDLVDGETVVRKYSDTDGDGQRDGLPSTYPLSDLQPLWEGGEALAGRTPSTRRISTLINGSWSKNNFVTGNRTALRPLLNAANDDEAGDIIEFIRGVPVVPDSPNPNTEYRDREIDGETWKLGDIVYSTPTVVGRPSENYHLVYGDTTYLKFVREHKDRETFIYVGANDGMLHAFSAGTYHEGDDSSTDPPIIEKGWYDGDFGTEDWAYIPYNLLPHLKWLAEPGYCHVYYVDLKAKVVDARIFTPDETTHFNGWGTVLIAGMRLGGKEITADGQPFRSAYFAIDITDPRNPDLLWEITADELGFTTSYPAVFRVGTAKPFDPGARQGDWYVIFGSGPTTFEGEGAATSHVYIRNLASGGAVRTFDIEEGGGVNPIYPVFMASPITIDLDLDYQVDVAYIGASYKDLSDSSKWKGKIFRIEIDEDTTEASWNLSPSPFVTFDQPITVAPIAALDPFNRLWLFWGTGRFFSTEDKVDANVQRLYGVWDRPQETTKVTVDVSSSGDPTALNDVTNIKVYEGGYMDTDTTPGQDTTFSSYLALKRGEYGAETTPKYGWYLNMTDPIALDGERAINTATVLGNIVLFPTFKPEADICEFGGNSYLYALYYETGTAYWKPVIGLHGTEGIDVSGWKSKILKKIGLGSGMPTSVVIHAGSEEGVRGMIQLGTGVVKVIDIDPASSPQSKVIFWREKAD